MSSVCRFCHATIKFVKLDSGKPIPIEPHPFPDRGTVAARLVAGRLEGYVTSAAKPLLPGYDTYVVHRANCKPDTPRVAPSERAASLFDA